MGLWLGLALSAGLTVGCVAPDLTKVANTQDDPIPTEAPVVEAPRTYLSMGRLPVELATRKAGTVWINTLTSVRIRISAAQGIEVLDPGRSSSATDFEAVSDPAPGAAFPATFGSTYLGYIKQGYLNLGAPIPVITAQLSYLKQDATQIIMNGGATYQAAVGIGQWDFVQAVLQSSAQDWGTCTSGAPILSSDLPSNKQIFADDPNPFYPGSFFGPGGIFPGMVPTFIPGAPIATNFPVSQYLCPILMDFHNAITFAKGQQMGQISYAGASAKAAFALAVSDAFDALIAGIN